jgi:uncharacterized membrane protein
MRGEQQIQVVVGAFDHVDGAAFAFGRVQTRQVRLHNHAILVRSAEGGLRVQEAGDIGPGKGAFIGAVASLLLPGIGLIGGAVVGGLAAKLRGSCFPAQQLRQLGEGLTPSSSALVLVVDPAAVDSIRPIIEKVRGRVVTGGVDAELVLPAPAGPSGNDSGARNEQGG